MLCVGLAKNQIRPDDDFHCEKCKVIVEGPSNISDRKENSQIHNKLNPNNGKVVDQSSKT